MADPEITRTQRITAFDARQRGSQAFIRTDTGTAFLYSDLHEIYTTGFFTFPSVRVMMTLYQEKESKQKGGILMVRMINVKHDEYREFPQCSFTYELCSALLCRDKTKRDRKHLLQ